MFMEEVLLQEVPVRFVKKVNFNHTKKVRIKNVAAISFKTAYQ